MHLTPEGQAKQGADLVESARNKEKYFQDFNGVLDALDDQVTEKDSMQFSLENFDMEPRARQNAAQNRADAVKIALNCSYEMDATPQPMASGEDLMAAGTVIDLSAEPDEESHSSDMVKI